MNYTVLLALFVVYAFFAFPSPISAAQTPHCTPIFGGSNSCLQTDPIQINKQIQNPANQNYVENLSATDATFAPGQIVRFKITVTNASNGTLKTITVRDGLPKAVSFSKGAGQYDKATNTFTFTIDELKGKESKVYFIETKAGLLTSNQQSACVINQVEATEGKRVSRDNAKFCITPKGVASTAAKTPGGSTIHQPNKTQRTPETGPEALAWMGLLPLGALGFFAKSKART